MLAGVPVYVLAWAVLRLFAGTSFESYWAALAVSYTPIGLALVAALIAAFAVSRNPGPQA